MEKLAGTDRVRSFQLAIKPARPFFYAEIGMRDIPLFGLPGNPVAAMVAFHLLARPAILKMAGRPPQDNTVLGIVDEPISRRPDGKTHFVLAKAVFGDDGRVHARAAEGQRPHMLRSMATCNALVMLEDGRGVTAGDEVGVVLLDPERVLTGC